MVDRDPPGKVSAPSLAARLAICAVVLYQKTLSPLFAGSCRFQPSCSVYSVQALRSHGFWRGLFLTMHRLVRCHPWGGSGVDPVP
ncbi:MAG: membrane protein insertion efficiency factor YidD [Phycisphaerales bacterium]|nr:membrane protein insertion efficiency factor YidD [Phycisphaerales bacterium]